MSDTKFTPGPWRHDGKTVYTQDHMNIALILHSGTADTCLIAAAPDLYAALEQAQAALNPMSRLVKKHREGGPESRFLDETRGAVRVALRKARGISP
jgi:hypothetical protein